MPLADRLAERFADAGIEGWAHAQNLTDGAQIGYRADEPVAMASLYKLPLLVAFASEWQQGSLDPLTELRLEPSELTPGPTGLGTLSDPVTTSLRNVAVLMATLSDNAAADIVMSAVGRDAIARVVEQAGLRATHVRTSAAEGQQSLLRQTRVRSLPRAFERLASNDELYGEVAYDPALTSPTSARDMTALLGAVWTGRIVQGEPLQFIRSVMRNQVWPHRLRAGFPYAAAQIAGKTGTLGALRHEVGVIELPHEPPYAVAVLTRAARADAVLPSADRAIGDVAREAVSMLRLRL